MPNGLALAIVLLILLLFVAYILSVLINFLSPFYTTPKKILKEFLKELHLKGENSFVDLGCGDGRVVFAVYDAFKCKSSGYEVSPILLLWLKFYKFVRYPFNPRVNILEESFLKADLSSFDVVYCCLPKDILEVLQKKFVKELKPGTKLYSYKNKVGNLKGKEIHIDKEKVYMYTF